MIQDYIDFHAHILPGADHGSNGIETSLKQLAMARNAGIGTIVATPHYYPDTHSIERFLVRTEKAYQELTAAAVGGPEILLAAEVKLCEGLNNLPELGRLKISGTDTILIEMPGPPWTERYLDTLERIEEGRGLKVVLAHVDRYDPADVEKLFARGMRGQVNASAFHHVILRRRLNRWINEGLIVALGSDVHGLSDAYADYTLAMQKLGERGEILQKAMGAIIKPN